MNTIKSLIKKLAIFIANLCIGIILVIISVYFIIQAAAGITGLLLSQADNLGEAILIVPLGLLIMTGIMFIGIIFINLIHKKYPNLRMFL